VTKAGECRKAIKIKESILKNKPFLILFAMASLFMLFNCDDAAVASHNLSRASDQFEVYRRVVFYNGITDAYILVVEGYCSIRVDGVDKQLELTVKTAPGEFKKHYLGISDNVTYFVEQIDSKNIPVDRYRVIFKPSAIVPNIDLE